MDGLVSWRVSGSAQDKREVVARRISPILWQVWSFPWLRHERIMRREPTLSRRATAASGEETMPILRQWAERYPAKIAALMAFSDQALTYGQLDRRSNAVAQLLMWLGLAPGDSVAIMLDNDLTYFEIMWGARRHGVYYTPVSAHLNPEEAAYIVRDSGAKAF